MPASQNSSPSSANDLAAGQQLLRGWWHGPHAWQDKLHKKAAHAALNIPEDEPMIVTTNNNARSGLGWKELLVMAAAVIGAAAITGYALKSNGTPAAVVAPAAATPATPAPTVPPAPAATSTTDTTTVKETRIEDYEIRFFDAASGQYVEVPHISKMPKEEAAP